MNTINYNHIQFQMSAELFSQLPADTSAEVAFAGRSNAGKSSALNAITGFKRLARTSKTPGRTQLINFFRLETGHYLVDLPGYGYAKVPENIKKRWKKSLTQYITERESLKGIILLMDIRHPLKPFDWQMIEWTTSHDLPIHILLTKSDKFKRGAAHNTLLAVRKALKDYQDFVTIQLFSAQNGTGIEEVQQKLDVWLLSP